MLGAWSRFLGFTLGVCLRICLSQKKISQKVLPSQINFIFGRSLQCDTEMGVCLYIFIIQLYIPPGVLCFR